MKLNKALFISIVCVALVSCHESLEDRAAKECKDYTLKKCPTPIVENTRMDSMVYEADTRTIHYYHSFFNEADNKELIAAHKQELRQTLLAAVKKDMGTKIYKEAGFNFRYTYHSGKAPKTVLFDQTYKKGEY